MLVTVGIGIDLALAPVNNAVLASAPAGAHGVASALVVVARMVGMVVGLALLTAIGLRRYYQTVAGLPDQGDPRELLAAGVVQVQTVFAGASVAALAGAVAAAGLGLRRTGDAGGHDGRSGGRQARGTDGDSPQGRRTGGSGGVRNPGGSDGLSRRAGR